MLAGSNAAWAATYDIYACTLPNNEPLATDEWRQYGADAGFATDLSCLDYGGLGVSLRRDRDYAPGAFGGVALQVPAPLRIVRYAADMRWDSTSELPAWAWESGVWAILYGQPQRVPVKLCIWDGACAS